MKQSLKAPLLVVLLLSSSFPSQVSANDTVSKCAIGALALIGLATITPPIYNLVVDSNAHQALNDAQKNIEKAAQLSGYNVPPVYDELLSLDLYHQVAFDKSVNPIDRSTPSYISRSFNQLESALKDSKYYVSDYYKDSLAKQGKYAEAMSAVQKIDTVLPRATSLNRFFSQQENNFNLYASVHSLDLYNDIKNDPLKHAARTYNNYTYPYLALKDTLERNKRSLDNAVSAGSLQKHWNNYRNALSLQASYKSTLDKVITSYEYQSQKQQQHRDELKEKEIRAQEKLISEQKEANRIAHQQIHVLQEANRIAQQQLSATQESNRIALWLQQIPASYHENIPDLKETIRQLQYELNSYKANAVWNYQLVQQLESKLNNLLRQHVPQYQYIPQYQNVDQK